jgi:DNA-binding MarR family transcriptional regulator
MTAETKPRPVPVAGPLFRQVAALKLEGVKRRKLLALIAAFADAGQDRPTVAELAERLKLDQRKVISLLDRLVQDGLLERSPATRRTPKLAVVIPEGGDRA